MLRKSGHLGTYGTRCLSVLWAALFVLGQFSGLVHLALVRHTTCLEHGELIEAGTAAASAAERARPPSPQVLPDARASHEHRHCLMLFQRREQLTAQVRGCPLPAPPSTVVLPCPGCDGPRVSAIALLRLAPKLSPPA